MSAIELRTIVALDFVDWESTRRFIDQVTPQHCRLKVGKELFTREGPAVVRLLQQRGFDVFLDLKFHDIPHTVAQAVRAACDLGVWMVNVHALGGMAMMEAARETVVRGNYVVHLIAVTILTSLTDDDLAAMGMGGGVKEFVPRLATAAHAAGLHGVVCSAHEAAMLRKQIGPDWLLVTPGVRLGAISNDDQKRVMSPAQARAAGADYLVIGRPVTRADNPSQVLLTIENEICRVSP